MRRTWVAAALLTVALAALLIAWFTSGWDDVRARQRAARAAPTTAAVAHGTALARELREELARVMALEVERPYFHYQNLMRDPRASRGSGVTPSPLATKVRDPLVRGYFQIDRTGRATTPTLNDDVPELSEPTQLADNLRFRDELRTSLAGVLAPTPDERVAAVTSTAPHDRTTTPAAARPASPRPARPAAQVHQAQQAQVITLDRDSYVQNTFSNQIYQGNARGDVATEPSLRAPPAVAATDAVAPAPPPATPRQVRPARASKPAVDPVRDPEPVTIVVAPLEWRTETFAGVPALVAVRAVATPDGPLRQGFVIDRATLAGWIGARVSDADAVVELRAGAGARELEVAPGWHLAAAPREPAVVAAATAATAIGSAFLVRFGVIGLIALLAAALVVWLVARAELLARERSEFAAAAAHELRTPLAGLQLYGDMLADGLGDLTKQRDYARRMSEEAARLGRVVSNVLGFAQLERGNLSVDPKVARLDDELRRLCERAAPALDRAGATLALDVPPELLARFDADALARIVGNLLDNAEKYGRDASDRSIALSARARADGVEVVIADHGPGILPTARARLFRPFARGVPHDGPAGLGLGLALSRSLACAMGGDLEYRTANGGGATFVLRLAPA